MTADATVCRLTRVALFLFCYFTHCFFSFNYCVLPVCLLFYLNQDGSIMKVLKKENHQEHRRNIRKDKIKSLTHSEKEVRH